VNGAEGASGLDQLHQLGVAGEKPLGTKGARESRFEGERGAGGVEVQDGDGAGGDKGKGEIGRGEPCGGFTDRFDLIGHIGPIVFPNEFVVNSSSNFVKHGFMLFDY
jgi:hypothetical protein